MDNRKPINRLFGFFKGKLLKDLGITVVLQIFARLIQMVGMIHVADCLGENNGESNEALSAAQYIQFLFTFGLDIVAVRHLAAKSVTFTELVPKVFTLRLLIYGFSSIIWCLGLLLSDLPKNQLQLWLAAILNLMALGMNFQWVFQGMQRMPKFSLIQAMTSIGIAIYFLLVFKRGIPVGADLWVMGIFQTVVTVGAWIYVRNHFRVRLFSFKGVRELLGYIYEGMPNWVFGLLYNTLITFGMLSIRKLTLGGPFQNHNDSFGNLQRVAMASQFILAFGGSVIYTRIVVWRHERDDFFLRVKLVCFAVITLGLFLCGFLHSIHNWLFPLIFPRTIYQSGAPYLSIVLFGRFLGLASGILVWSLLAYRKDWVAVKCAILPVLLSVGLHFYYVPLFGLKAASFLYIGGEMGLFLCCAIAFLILKKEIINKSA